jgi:hypothetical protein
MNPNYVIVIKNDLNKFLIEGFIVLVDKTTWFSRIMVVPKKNDKLHLCWFQETKCSVSHTDTTMCGSLNF